MIHLNSHSWMSRGRLCLLLFFLGISVSPSAGEVEREKCGGEPAEKVQDSPFVVLRPQRIAVLSAEVSARVIRFERQMGEVFQQGDPLVRLDDSLFLIHCEKALAQAQATEEMLATAQRLFEGKSVPSEVLVKARRDHSIALAERKQAEKMLESCTISAPYPGRVVKHFVQEQELTQRSTQLISVVDDSVLLASFFMPASHYSTVVMGAVAEIRLDEGDDGRPITGRVVQISPVMDAASSSFEVVAGVDNREGLFRGGMTGRLLGLKSGGDADGAKP